MNKIKKLQQLIDRGKLLEENKTSRIVQMTIQKNGFNYYKDSNVFDVNKEQYDVWDKDVQNFLIKNNLKTFVEPKGINNDFQESIKGNYINFQPQYEKLCSLYQLVLILNNKKLIFVEDKKVIEKNILFILSSNKNEYIEILETYAQAISFSFFQEVFKELQKKDLVNISILGSSADSISWNISHKKFLTLKGLQYYQSIDKKTIKWEKIGFWIGIIIALATLGWNIYVDCNSSLLNKPLSMDNNNG